MGDSQVTTGEPSSGGQQMIVLGEEDVKLLKEKVVLAGSRKWLDKIRAEVNAGNSGRRWSASEDILLLEAYREFGSRWTEIAKKMNGSREAKRLKAAVLRNEVGLSEVLIPRYSRPLATAESKWKAGAGAAGKSSGSSSVALSDVYATARCIVSQAWLDIQEMKQMGIRDSSLNLTTSNELAHFLEL